MDERPVSIEEALALAKEIGESLGGRQQRALEILCREVRIAHKLTRRPSSTSIPAATASEAFAKVAEILKPEGDP